MIAVTVYIPASAETACDVILGVAACLQTTVSPNTLLFPAHRLRLSRLDKLRHKNGAVHRKMNVVGLRKEICHALSSGHFLTFVAPPLGIITVSTVLPAASSVQVS